MTRSDQHMEEMRRNQDSWRRKPLLRKVYGNFYREIARHLCDLPGATVEIGSGVCGIRDVIPDCVCTDLFPNPGLDRVENVYRLSFADCSLANVILFDVFHHLRYPGSALEEIRRTLVPGGRLIVFEPCISLLGALVFGLLHHEPVGITQRIEWYAPSGWRPEDLDYYAAQGNATRKFIWGDGADLPGWRSLRTVQLSALSYVASGGYSKPQLYPTAWYPLVRDIERILDPFPRLFATRVLVVLQREADGLGTHAPSQVDGTPAT